MKRKYEVLFKSLLTLLLTALSSLVYLIKCFKSFKDIYILKTEGVKEWCFVMCWMNKLTKREQHIFDFHVLVVFRVPGRPRHLPAGERRLWPFLWWRQGRTKTKVLVCRRLLPGRWWAELRSKWWEVVLYFIVSQIRKIFSDSVSFENVFLPQN